MGMVINVKKTNMLVVNPTNTVQSIPFVALKDGDPIPVVDEMRFLGLLFDSDLSWWPLVLDLVKRCNCKIWSLAKLREVGADEDQLLALYIARVRGTIEYGAQVYGAVVNKSQSNVLERVQIRCLQIVRGAKSSSYCTYGICFSHSRQSQSEKY